MRETAKRFAARLGLDVHRRSLTHAARRVAALREGSIDVVIDVGANEGQYVTWLREFGYSGRIISLEPLPSAFAALRLHHGHDPRWIGLNLAAGAAASNATLHVTGSTLLSSLLEPAEPLTSRIAASVELDTVEVAVVALDEVWADLVQSNERVMLKIDTQGYENQVLDGACQRMADIAMIEIEMALTQMYHGGSTIYDLLPRLHNDGFSIISIDSGYVDEITGQVLDVDVLLGRDAT